MAIEDIIAALQRHPAAKPVCWIVCYEARLLQGVPPGGEGPHLLVFSSPARAEAFIAGRQRFFMPEPLSVVGVDSAQTLRALVSTPARDSRFEPPPCGLLLDFAYPTGATARALTPQQAAALDAKGLAKALGLKAPAPPAPKVKPSPPPVAKPAPPVPKMEPAPPPPAEVPPRARRVSGWAWALLVVALLLLCCVCCVVAGGVGWATSGGWPVVPTAAAGGRPPTVAATPTRTSTGLPGASGTPAVYLGTPGAGIDMIGAYVVTAPKDLDAGQSLSNVFPSGTRELYFVARFRSEPPNGTRITWEVHGASGPVLLVGSDLVVTRSARTGETTVSMPRSPASGTFADGPYQAKLLIDDRLIAVLNWAVGGPGAPPVATPAPSPSPRPAQTPTVAPGGAGPLPPATPFVCPNPHTVDFSSVLQFGRFDDPWARARVLDGEYLITMKQADSWAWATDEFRVTDGVFEVEARQAAAGPGAYGLAFAVDDPSNLKQLYAFAIESDGYYILSKYTEGGGWVDLKTRSSSPFLYAGDDQSNRLRVVRQGSLIALYANDVPLATVYYPTIVDGRYAGLIAWSGRDAAGLETRFDNYAVCPLTAPYLMPINPFTRKAQRVPASQPLVLTYAWPAATVDLARAFAEQADTTVVIDRRTYSGLRDYWSAPGPCPQGYVVQWNLPLPALARGKHRIEIRVSLPQALTDGFDEDRDGQPDTHGPGQVLGEWMDLTVE